MKKLSIDTRLILIISGIAILLIAIKSHYSKKYSIAPEIKQEEKTVLCAAISKFDNIGESDDSIVREKRINYIKRFYKIAEKENEKFGIPASIILAQGILESNNGESNLTKNTNNHFGIKCFSKKCKNGHCVNYSDDSHKDFFKKYPSAWQSFRDHSILLSRNKYKNLAWKSQKAWVSGLVKNGYATDKNYSKKLMHIINDYKLHNFDK